MSENINSSEMNSSSDLQLLDTTSSPESINAESDNDSGIVAIANSNRVGSTASNSDEDHVFKDRLNQSANQLNYVTKPRVRFDDELPLSEQSIRKSCKKLFEKLYLQNKEDIPVSTSISDESVTDQISLTLPSCHCHHFTQSLPSPAAKNSQQQHKNCCAQVSDQKQCVVEPIEQYEGNEMLLQNYIKPEQQKPHFSFSKEMPTNRSQKYNSLDNRQTGRSVWPLSSHIKPKTTDESHVIKKSLDCDAALDRIKRMSDRLESSSMVNAFARPAFIKSAEFGQTMDTLYETIFPTEVSTKYSANNHVNQWLNNNNNNSINNNNTRVVAKVEVADSISAKNKELNPSLLLANRQVLTDSNARKSILKPISNDSSRVNSLSPMTKSSYISADQIYPDQSTAADDSDHKFDSSYEEEEQRISQRFSSSYSAGDDIRKGILRQTRLKSAVSEFDLNHTKMNSSPKSKTFLQRFKSVLTRAFTNTTNDRVTKQQSILDLNTVKNSRSLSQTDLSVNLKGSRTSIMANNSTGRHRIDRSPSFVKNIRTRMSLRKTNKDHSIDRISRSNSHKSLVSENHKNNKSTKHLDSNTNESTDIKVWGELIKLNAADSSQVIQIHRQKGRAFGFFVARGTVNNIKGVFVSRMKDEETQKSLTGVLEIGDEILAIDGESVKEANIMRVNQLIANKDTIRLTIIPYMNNKYL